MSVLFDIGYKLILLPARLVSREEIADAIATWVQTLAGSPVGLPWTWREESRGDGEPKKVLALGNGWRLASADNAAAIDGLVRSTDADGRARPPVANVVGWGTVRIQHENKDTLEADPPKFAILTALGKEFNAVCRLLNDVSDYVDDDGFGWVCGRVPARNGHHRVVVAEAGMGNNLAAIVAAKARHEFPQVSTMLMVGIAGAVPAPCDAENHVRLGDIVISGEGGVVQYDMAKDVSGVLEPRHSPRPPSSMMLQASTRIRQKLEGAQRPFHLDPGCARPDANDVLRGSANPEDIIPHPDDPQRLAGKPRIFVGNIGAGNLLLKNRERRDELRDRFKVRAVEMESSGIADAAWLTGRSYFGVRGTCDYCDEHKNDDWQQYAASIAAEFCMSILAETNTQ